MPIHSEKKALSDGVIQIPPKKLLRELKFAKIKDKPIEGEL
jgi:hypothetical protein